MHKHVIKYWFCFWRTHLGLFIFYFILACTYICLGQLCSLSFSGAQHMLGLFIFYFITAHPLCQIFGDRVFWETIQFHGRRIPAWKLVKRKLYARTMETNNNMCTSRGVVSCPSCCNNQTDCSSVEGSIIPQNTVG